MCYVLSALAQRGGPFGQGHTAHQWGRKDQDASSPTGSPCSVALPSLSWKTFVMGERFVPAQPMAALQYSVPLTIFPGGEPSVSWRPWDFILMFAKPRQGPEALSLMAPRFMMSKPIQWRVFTEAGWKTELNCNSPQDTALPTSVSAADGCQMMMPHPGGRKPPTRSRQWVSPNAPRPINRFNWGNKQGAAEKQRLLRIT